MLHKKNFPLNSLIILSAFFNQIKQGLNLQKKRTKTPTVLQMEAVECGAAALGIVLAYYGKYVPLEELRIECGVSRDGSKASNMMKAARHYGLQAKGFRRDPEDLKKMQMPAILHWNFNHFLVLEGFQKGRVFLNDPAKGPRVVGEEEFDESFTGVILTFEPEAYFVRQEKKESIFNSLKQRLTGSEMAVVYVVLVSLCLIIPGLIVPIFSKVFVDEFLVKQMHDWLKPLLIAMGVTVLIRAGLTWLQQNYLLRMETKLTLSTSSKFLWHIFRLPTEFFTQRYSGDITSRIMINDRVAQLLSGELATTALNITMIVFYVIIMFYYDVVLTIIGISISVLNVLVLKYVSRKRVDENQKLLQEYGKMMGIAMNGLQMIETLKASGGESDFFARWAGHQAKMVNAQQKLGIYTQFLMAVPQLLLTVNTAVILALGSMRVMDGYLSMGMLVAFQSLMSSFTGPVTRLVNLGTTLQDAEGDMNRLNDVLRYKIDGRLAGKTVEAAQTENVVKLTGELELKNITFGYSHMDPPLIENFCLRVKPGSRVALVGGSGSGKSTIAKLVAGLYKPWSGEILLDGIPRDEVTVNVLNNSFGMVDQDIFLYEGLVWENMTLWDPTTPKTDIIQAAKDACIHEDIAIKPGAYDGHIEENGANFSGGQRQRLEIARALVNNPTILVLDEATSALDPVTEKRIDDNLRRRGCTCLIVAHRLSTIRDCDEIIVLERGKVVQRGTHDQLKSKEGLYACLIES